MSPAGLLSLALLVPAAPPRAAGPQLQRGDELVYTGTVAEAIDRPGTRFQRSHEIEVRVFVLNRKEEYTDAAVLVLLRRIEDGTVAGGIPVVTGAVPHRAPAPPAARLDLVRVGRDGNARLILPDPPLPLRFAADTPSRGFPTVPLDTFAPFEFGIFPPPPRSDESWTVADPGRPAETWHNRGFDFVNGSRCRKLVMIQQSADWEKPQGGQTSWQRVDETWLSTLDGTARKVHRLIRQRDGIEENAAVQIEVKYELKDQTRLIGRTYDRYRQEIEIAYSAAAELAGLMKSPEQAGRRAFEARMARLDGHLEENSPGTPYREAVLAVRRQYEAARRGNIPTLPAAPVPERPPQRDEPSSASPSLAPEIRSGMFHLRDHRGKPVVLVFFRPGMETTDLSLAIAAALCKRYGERIAVAPLVVFGEVAAGEKDRDRLGLDVPIHDGSAAEQAYGIDTFPRFLVIDAAGRILWTFAGVGAETGFLVREQVDSLLGADGTAAPGGTGYPTGTATIRTRPRP